MMLYIDYFQVIGVRQVNIFISPASAQIILYGKLLLHNGNGIFRDILVIFFFLDFRARDLLNLCFLYGEDLIVRLDV